MLLVNLVKRLQSLLLSYGMRQDELVVLFIAEWIRWQSAALRAGCFQGAASQKKANLLPLEAPGSVTKAAAIQSVICEVVHILSKAMTTVFTAAAPLRSLHDQKHQERHSTSWAQIQLTYSDTHQQHEWDLWRATPCDSIVNPRSPDLLELGTEVNP